MQFYLYDLSKRTEWDAIVTSFAQHDVYYLAGYADTLEKNGEGIAQLIYCTNGDQRAIQVALKREIAQLGEGYADYITPYNCGGPLLENMTPDVFWPAYQAFCQQNHIVCEFINYHPLLQNQDAQAQIAGPSIFIDTTQPEQIDCNMHSKCRNMVRKAIKNGVVVEKIEGLDWQDEFMTIYQETMDRDAASSYYYFNEAYYQNLFSNLQGHVVMYRARFEETTIAMCILFYCGKWAHYHLSCAKREYMKFAPTNLLLYTAAKDCAACGVKDFYLGGGLGGAEDSLYSFKKSFHRTGVLLRYFGKKVYDTKVYEALVEQTNTAGSVFFPAYRSPKKV